MEYLLEQSKEIVLKAIEQYKPYAILVAFSGGSDSLTAYTVAKEIGVPLDGLVFVNTRTGIQETTMYVREFAEREGIRYLEGDAGPDYEHYVRRKGFWGKGVQAHSLAYQLLKATNLRKAISREIRQRKRNRRVLLINGVREEESANRKRNYAGGYYNADPGAKSNIWVNLLWHYTKKDCLSFLGDKGIELNPVVPLLHRSGECMCGTMQSEEDRRMASFFFPAWGRWLDSLEQEVKVEHPWGWGENMPKGFKQKKCVSSDMHMCVGCQLNE